LCQIRIKRLLSSQKSQPALSAQCAKLGSPEFSSQKSQLLCKQRNNSSVSSWKRQLCHIQKKPALPAHEPKKNSQQLHQLLRQTRSVSSEKSQINHINHWIKPEVPALSAPQKILLGTKINHQQC
jgi:hypothetical protein